jgi:hypothetical protein
VKIIAVTGWAPNNVAEVGEFTVFMQKPVDLDCFAVTIRKLAVAA